MKQTYKMQAFVLALNFSLPAQSFEAIIKASPEDFSVYEWAPVLLQFRPDSQAPEREPSQESSALLTQLATALVHSVKNLDMQKNSSYEDPRVIVRIPPSQIAEINNHAGFIFNTEAHHSAKTLSAYEGSLDLHDEPTSLFPKYGFLNFFSKEALFRIYDSSKLFHKGDLLFVMSRSVNKRTSYTTVHTDNSEDTFLSLDDNALITRFENKDAKNLSFLQTQTWGPLHMRQVDEIWIVGYTKDFSHDLAFQKLIKGYGVRVYNAEKENSHLANDALGLRLTPIEKYTCKKTCGNRPNLNLKSLSAHSDPRTLSLLSDLQICSYIDSTKKESIQSRMEDAQKLMLELGSDTLFKASVRLAAIKYLSRSCFASLEPEQILPLLKSLSLKDMIEELGDQNLDEILLPLQKLCSEEDHFACSKIGFKKLKDYITEVKESKLGVDTLSELDAEASLQISSCRDSKEFEEILNKPRLNDSPEAIQIKLNILFRGLDFYKTLEPGDYQNLAKHLSTPHIFDDASYEPFLKILDKERDSSSDILSEIHKLDSNQFSAEQEKNYLNFKSRF